MKKLTTYNLQLTTGKEGAALILTFIFMITLVVIVAAYLFMATGGIRNVNAQINNATAFYLAEAGLNKAVWYLMNTAPDGTTDGSWRTTAYPASPGPEPADPRQESLGDGTYTMWVEDLGSDILITARGTVNNIQRIVQQEVNLSVGWASAFSYAIYGDDTSNTLELKNNTTINGHLYYDYFNGRVEVETNASVPAPYYIYANSITGGGTYTQAPSAPNPLPSFPTFDTTTYNNAISTAESQASENLTLSGNSNLTLSGSTVYYKKVTVKNNATVTGPGTIVATKDVVIKNNANIGEGVTIISKKNMELKNDSIVQQDSLLYARKDITLQGSVNVTASVIAPVSGKKVKMEDNSTLTGIIYGSKAELKDDATINGAVVVNNYKGDKIKDNITVNYNSSYLPSSIPTGLEKDITVTSVTDSWREI